MGNWGVQLILKLVLALVLTLEQLLDLEQLLHLFKISQATPRPVTDDLVMILTLSIPQIPSPAPVKTPIPLLIPIPEYATAPLKPFIKWIIVPSTSGDWES